MKAAVLALLRFYRRWISPALPHACRYVPTCSEYAMEAVEIHGVLRGGGRALARLLRCHPFSQGGFDPVDRPAAGPCLVHSQRGASRPAPAAARPYLDFRKPDPPQRVAARREG